MEHLSGRTILIIFINSSHLPYFFPQFFETFFVQRNWSRNHLVIDSTGSWVTGKELCRQENRVILHLFKGPCQEVGILPSTILVIHIDTSWFSSLMATFPYSMHQLVTLVSQQVSMCQHIEVQWIVGPQSSNYNTPSWVEVILGKLPLPKEHWKWGHLMFIDMVQLGNPHSVPTPDPCVGQSARRACVSAEQARSSGKGTN